MARAGILGSVDTDCPGVLDGTSGPTVQSKYVLAQAAVWTVPSLTVKPGTPCISSNKDGGNVSPETALQPQSLP